MAKLKISLGQMQIALGDVRKNVNTAEELVTLRVKHSSSDKPAEVARVAV